MIAEWVVIAKDSLWRACANSFNRFPQHPQLELKQLKTYFEIPKLVYLRFVSHLKESSVSRILVRIKI